MVGKLECKKCDTLNRAGNACMCSRSSVTAWNRIDLDSFLVSYEDALMATPDVHSEVVRNAAEMIAKKNEKTLEQALIVKQHEEIIELKAENERLRKCASLLVIAKCPDGNCDGNGTTLESAPACCMMPDQHGDCCGHPSLDPAPCQWCHEKVAALSLTGKGDKP